MFGADIDRSPEEGAGPPGDSVWLMGRTHGWQLAEGLESSLQREAGTEVKALVLSTPHSSHLCWRRPEAQVWDLAVVMSPRWAFFQDELTDLALPCTVSGMKKPLVLGIKGKLQGLQVGIAISAEGSDRLAQGGGDHTEARHCPGYQPPPG